jgi:ADP-ribose pyrophosphatase
MFEADKKFQIIEKKAVFDGFFKVNQVTFKHTLYRGGWSEPLEREVFERGNCVAVLLYDPKRDEVVIIEQVRAGALKLGAEQAWLLEIVAGAIEEGETAEDVAYRESIEESGCEVQELIKIMDFFTSPGGTSELLTLFCGKVDTTNVGGIHGLEHEHEDIAVKAVAFNEVCELLENGKLLSAIPIIAVQWLQLNRLSLREKWL